MPEKRSTFSDLEPQELAKHLRKPNGEKGKKVGQQMNKGNKYICMNSYKVLAPSKNDVILEIGMGNGLFIKDLLVMTENLSYTGVDFSETMIQEASEINIDFVKQGIVNFKEASIENLPFKDNHFNLITTTNTLYFWPNPIENIKELLRILKPNGKLLVAYRSKSCMDQIELSKYGFDKYEKEEVENLFNTAGFQKITTETIEEPELDFDGKMFKMKGLYTTGIK